MDSYTPLLEKTRIPQPSLQKLAVASIFDKFSSAPPSDAGRDALSRCLRSASAAVVDQSTRELCRLVRDDKFDLSDGLLELQSALEDCTNPQFAAVFVKAIGLLTRLGFERNPSSFRFSSSQNHPFVKLHSCGAEVQGGLVKEVAMFIIKCKYLGMRTVCEFLGPFLNSSVLQDPVSASSYTYQRNLVSTMAAFCCSSPEEAIPIIKLLTTLLKYIPCKNAEGVANISAIFECLVDTYQVVLRQLVKMGLLIQEAQLCGLELLDSILSLHRDFRSYSGVVEKILDAVRHILVVQKELGLNYCAGQSSVILSLFYILTQLELEHEQYSALNLALFLLRWKDEDGCRTGASTSELSEELLLIFPVLALVSSPSRSIKQTATYLLSVLGKTASDILIAPRKEKVAEGQNLTNSTPGHIIFRFIRNILFKDQVSLLDGFYYVSHFSDEDVLDVSSCEVRSELKTWTFSIKQYSLGITAKRKSGLGISQSEESFLTDLPLILCSVAGVFLVHQKTNFAMDLFAIGGNCEPKLGVPLLLTVLFYNHVCSSAEKNIDFHDMLLKLLALLPSVASHSAMIPLLHQVLLPMLHKDVNPFIKATAIRLICKTWEINDRVFGSLQGMLHPNELALHSTERGICMSIAVSIQDVCKRNPDRGVDIILSVAACIENRDPLVQSVGLQSLAYLCEADVIDFYTAWDVVGKQTQNYSANAIVAYGLAHFLRWGAMDAEAYPEAATDVLNILWKIGTERKVSQSSLWTRSQEAAFRALLQYEVVHVQRSIPDFSTRNMDFLFSQTNPDLLGAIEEFEVRLINYEHITRRRSVKQKTISGPRNKIFKLLDVVPEAIFGSGSNHRIKELPGAALLCFPTRKDLINQGSLKGLQDVHSRYEDAALEISGSLLLSRNILLALVSLQSWKPFMERWLRSSVMVLEAKTHLTMLDKTSKAATDIFKILARLAEAAIPRFAENIALALGAFCLVLPATAHAVQSMASQFLLNWLSQYQHEHRQWSAAMSLGLISSSLHVTDHEQKSNNITALLEVASSSKSALVKGACGIGLGFSCHGLLNRVDSVPNAQSGKETYKNQELELLRKIVKTLIQMTEQLSGSSTGILEKLASYFPLGTVDSSSSKAGILDDDIDYLEEDVWGAAGPVIGLGNSLGAIYRAGARDAVLYLKSLVISWIPSADDLFRKHGREETCLSEFAVGACLSIPTVVSFCHKVELIDDIELKNLVSNFMELISGLLSVDHSDNFLQNLLMTSCVGAGSFLSIVLNSRLPSLKEEHVKGFFELCRRTYSTTYLPSVRLGGMLGVVNAMGAGAGTLIQQLQFSSSSNMFKQKEPSHMLVSLEDELTSIIQEIFLFAQNPDDPQSQQNAAWAVSVLRHSVFSKEHTADTEHDDSVAPNSASQGVAEDTIVMKLSLWLMKIDYSELGTGVSSRTISSVLRCLSRAPRLPLLDWGEIARRCMKYGDRTAEMPSQDINLRKGTLREECFMFILSHSHHSDSLLGFIDELYDGARFKTLESNLQSLMLSHLADLLKIFSNSRVAKLFDDISDFLLSFASSDQHNNEEKISMRVSSWKSLHLCLNESAAIETQDYSYNLEHCMEVLFTMLPWSQSSVHTELHRKNSNSEWTEAIRCLGKAQQGWLSKFLLIPDASFKEESKQLSETLKKVKAKAALVRVGSISLAELSKLKAYILDSDSEVIWSILVEVTVTLQHCDVSVRRQWLSDTAEILCVTSHPSTALRFLGLLSGSCCKYMPILYADKASVLTDLPTTLPSLLSSTGWGMVAESVALHLLRATERVRDWASNVKHGHYLPDSQPIVSAEEDGVIFLLRVMHETCVLVKEYLPLDKQLRLANMALDS